MVACQAKFQQPRDHRNREERQELSEEQRQRSSEGRCRRYQWERGAIVDDEEWERGGGELVDRGCAGESAVDALRKGRGGEKRKEGSVDAVATRRSGEGVAVGDESDNHHAESLGQCQWDRKEGGVVEKGWARGGEEWKVASAHEPREQRWATTIKKEVNSEVEKTRSNGEKVFSGDNTDSRSRQRAIQSLGQFQRYEWQGGGDDDEYTRSGGGREVVDVRIFTSGQKQGHRDSPELDVAELIEKRRGSGGEGFEKAKGQFEAAKIGEESRAEGEKARTNGEVLPVDCVADHHHHHHHSENSSGECRRYQWEGGATVADEGGWNQRKSADDLKNLNWSADDLRNELKNKNNNNNNKHLENALSRPSAGLEVAKIGESRPEVERTRSYGEPVGAGGHSQSIGYSDEEYEDDVEYDEDLEEEEEGGGYEVDEVDTELEDEDEASKTDRWVQKKVVTTRVEHEKCLERGGGQSELIPNLDEPAFGDVRIKNSQHVHVGNTNFYKGPVTIKQFVYTNAYPGLDKDDTEGSSSTRISDANPNDVPIVNPNGPILPPRRDYDSVALWLWTWRCAAILCVLALSLVTVVTVVSVLLTRNTDLPSQPSDEVVDSPTSGVDADLPSSTVRIIERIFWGAQPPARPLDKLRESPVPFVIISHTASTPCTTQSACVLQVRLAQTLHIESNGWDDIGYNFLVGGDGLAYMARGWDLAGSHAFGYNSISMGISFIGTFNTVRPPKIQLQAAQRLIELGVNMSKIRTDYKLLGHRQVSKTLSPGDKLFQILKTWEHWSADTTRP